MTRRPFLHSLLLLALLPVAAFAAGASAAAEPVAGTDYEVIEGGQPFAAAKGKIEVVEVFGYGCHFCAEFAPKIEAWKRTLPADVTLTYLPLPRGNDDPLAIAFFAAQTTGALAKTHAATFRAIHEAHSLPRNPTVDEMATFYGQLGVDEGKLRNAMLAASTVARLAPARQFAIASGVEGTPTLVINGKYRVTGRSLDDTLRIADQLIARERGSATH